MRNLIILLLLLSSGPFLQAQEAPKPYNENVVARIEIKKAIELAGKENKHVLVQFGGNWCPWCLRFHAFVNNIPVVDSMMKADYIYVLANVPREKEKRDFTLFREYEYPNRFGYPVFVILDGSGKKLHIQDSGFLESCVGKGYDTTKVVTFLRTWNVKAVDPKSYPEK